MDEPTAALTRDEAERLFAVLREIRAPGRSVLYVSHRLDEVMAHLRPASPCCATGAASIRAAMADITHDELVR